MLLNLYSLDFSYPRVCGCSGGNGIYICTGPAFDTESVELWERANSIARKAEIDCGLFTCHEYSFPDGSIYHKVLTHLGYDELLKNLSEKLTENVKVKIQKLEMCCNECKLDADKVGNPKMPFNVELDIQQSLLICRNNKEHNRHFSVEWAPDERQRLDKILAPRTLESVADEVVALVYFDTNVVVDKDEVIKALKLDGGKLPKAKEVEALVCGLEDTGKVPPVLVARFKNLDYYLDSLLA